MGQKIELSFLTGNHHKFIEAREALAVYPNIELTQIIEEKTEIKDDAAEDPIVEIAGKAALEGTRKHGVPVAVEDAGLFFYAYPGFPGLNTKWVMKSIDYEGILRLLAGKDRRACFRSAVAFCEPGGAPLVFEGRIEGLISEEVMGLDQDCMDYDRVFIPQGHSRPFALMMDEKRQMSHRKIAFLKLGEYLSRRASG